MSRFAREDVPPRRGAREPCSAECDAGGKGRLSIRLLRLTKGDLKWFFLAVFALSNGFQIFVSYRDWGLFLFFLQRISIILSVSSFLHHPLVLIMQGVCSRFQQTQKSGNFSKTSFQDHNKQSDIQDEQIPYRFLLVVSI